MWTREGVGGWVLTLEFTMKGDNRSFKFLVKAFNHFYLPPPHDLLLPMQLWSNLEGLRCFINNLFLVQSVKWRYQGVWSKKNHFVLFFLFFRFSVLIFNTKAKEHLHLRICHQVCRTLIRDRQCGLVHSRLVQDLMTMPHLF